MSTYTFPAADVTDTSLTFTGTLPPDAGAYDVVVKDAAGTELGREVDGITLTPAAVPTAEITNVYPGTAVEANAATLTAVGTGLAGITKVVLTEQTSSTPTELVAAGAIDTGFTVDWASPVIGTYDLQALDATDTEIASYADAVTVVAVPTVPTIFDIWPSEVPPYTNTWFNVFGWLLDPVDCIGVDEQGGGGTNWSGLDFTNTGLQPLPWAYSLNPGVWDWHLKQGGSGGTTLVSKIGAVTAGPVSFESITPDTVAPGVSQQFTCHGDGLLYVQLIDILDSAGAVVLADIPADNSVGVLPPIFTATLPTVGSYSVVLKDNMDLGASVRLDDAITVEDALSVPTITSVTPDTAEQSGTVPTTFTAAGILLGDTAGVSVVQPDGNALRPPAENVTDTGFIFTVVLSQVGSNDVIALNDVDGEIARLDDAIAVTAPVPPAITSVTPSNVQPGIDQTYTVAGVSLGTTTKAGRRNNGLTDETWTDIPVSGVSDTGFTFTQNFGETVLDIAAFAGTEKLAQKDAAITVANTTPRIDAVDPTSTWVNHTGIFVVTGYGLLEIETIRIGTSGVGFDDFLNWQFTVRTDTRIEFEGAITRIGLHDVVGNASAGTAYLRKDDCLQVNSQLTLGRGTRIPTRDLEIECGPAAQIVERLNELKAEPDVAEAWGADDHATIVCEDDSTVDVTWDGEVWVVWVVVTPSQATLTRGETKSARELGIGRCAVTRKGTAQRLNNAGVEADPPENWGPGSCAYVLCNTGVHDDVRWDGTAWRECT